jgi:tetratricopeptide (TPR) repeat protein
MTPHAIDGLYGTGYWLLEEGRHKDALAAFQLMLLVAPRDERAWLGLGVCHEARGDRMTALQIYEMAVRAARPAPRCALARARLFRIENDPVAAHAAYEDAIAHAAVANDDEVERIALVEKDAA